MGHSDNEWCIRPSCAYQSAVPRWLWLLVICVFAVLLGLATDDYTQPAYHSTVGSNDALNLPAAFLTELLKLKPVLLAMIALLLADRRLRWRFAADFSAVILVQAGVGSALKELFQRIRPDDFEAAGIFYGPLADVKGNAFPSGHATAAWAIAAVMAAYYPRWRWLFYIGAVAVCWARLQLNAHYPGDLIAGGVVGWFVAQALMAWMGRVRARRAARALVAD